MATAGVSTVFDNSTDALYRAWISQIMADLTAVGWVQTAHTGQIDPLTVLKPTGAFQQGGYSIWTPNDGLTPFYLRIGFGSSAAGALSPGILVSASWDLASLTAGINFAGVNLSHHYQLFGTNANAGVTCTPKLCKVGSACWFQWHDANPGGGNTNHAFGIDRWRDEDGTPNEDGFHLIAAGCGDSRTVHNHDTGGGTQYTAIDSVPHPSVGGPAHNYGNSRVPYAAPNVSSSWGYGGNVGVAPIHPWYGGAKGAMLCAVIGSPTDFAAVGATTSVTIHGAAHTFNRTEARPDSSGFGRYLMLWE